MKCFRIIDSFILRDRWFLGAPIGEKGDELDPRSFTEGSRYDGEKIIEIPITQGTRPLAFTLASFDMPVVRTHIARRIQAMASDCIQRVPVKSIDGQDDYEILNVLSLLKGINEQFSQITRWTERDGIPSRVGRYAGIAKLVLDESVITGNEIFRIKDWELPLIVSERMKDDLEEMLVDGIAFQELQVL